MKKSILITFLATLGFCGSAFAEKTDIELIGQQGTHYFFVVSKPWITDAGYIENSGKAICASKSVCIAHFWERGTPAPTRLPMTEAQAKAEMAVFRVNKNSGLSEMLWRCGKYQHATEQNCFSD